MGEVSGTRLYLGNLPRDVTKREVEDFFKEHGQGNIVEVKLMNGFGFIQYDNEEDPKDVVPVYNGRDFKGQRLTVQFARGTRHPPRDNYSADRGYPRTRRTQFRMNISGLSTDTSWQDLKDFARKSNRDVVFSEVSRDGRGIVEFETYDDLKDAIQKLDQTEFKGARVTCVSDENGNGMPPLRGGSGRYRSRSPHQGRHSPPPRGYSPPRRRDFSPRRRDHSPRRDYRDRSPHRESHYHSDRRDTRDRYASPPRRNGGHSTDDSYRRYPEDSYASTKGRGYDSQHREAPASYANGSSRRGPPPIDDAPPPRGRNTSPGGGRGGRGTPPRFRGPRRGVSRKH